MPETDCLLKKDEVNKFRKLSHHYTDIRYHLFTMSDHFPKITQIPPMTKFLYVHRNGLNEQDFSNLNHWLTIPIFVCNVCVC